MSLKVSKSPVYTVCIAFTLAVLGCAESEQETNPLAVDDDGDGYSEFDGDCDDGDANSTIQSDDADCDGALTADDCNDNDANSTIQRDDADCDTVLTADDCDDNDSSLGDKASDPDCDGFTTFTWTGEREFEFSSGCRDFVGENGFEVQPDHDPEGAWAGCSDCDHLFFVEMDKERICDNLLPITAKVYRGVRFDGDSATVYWVYVSDSGAWNRWKLADRADWDGVVLKYNYIGGDGASSYSVNAYAEIR